MTTLVDCRKFVANVFNHTKCQNCFRTKDAHTVEALESCKSSRKITKCGYLFVAPDWDFSLYTNRTKRWQRRWFILYDDGELTYSLDEHPETVPQAVIDMNKVVEVSDAEDRTGNQYAISITAPEKVHFVKGTCKKEKKWWYDVLSRFPKFTNKNGKQRRNVSFAGIKATSVINEAVRNSKNSRQDMIMKLDSKSSLSIVSYKNEINMPSNTSDVIWNDINYYNDQINTKIVENVIKTHDPNMQLTSTGDTEGVKLLKRKLNKANITAKEMSQKLEEAYANYDYLELAYDKLTKHITQLEETHHAQLMLMNNRIDDLTCKYTTSERSLRQAKQRISKFETRHERKRSSLKGKEYVTLSKEFDAKLKELENKFDTISKYVYNSNSINGHSESDRDSTSTLSHCDKSNVLGEKRELQRKLSQDSNCSESQMMCLRLLQLETKVKEIANNLSLSLSSSEFRSSPKLAQLIDKPKIRLQIRNNSEISNESEDWGCISLATSMNDLQEIESSDDNRSSLNECPCCSDRSDRDDYKELKSIKSPLNCTDENTKNGDIFYTMESLRMDMDISPLNSLALR